MTYNTFPTLQGLGWPVNITPTFRTHIETTRAGAQFRSQMWPATLHTFEIVFNYLSANDYETLKAFYAGQLGGWMPFWFTPTGSTTQYLCVFPAEITYEQFVNNLYKAKKVILQEVR